MLESTQARSSVQQSQTSGLTAGLGAVADSHGEIVRRVDATSAALKIGDSVVTGTSDLALGVLVTAPELIPEVRALAACRRLFAREQSARK